MTSSGFRRVVPCPDFDTDDDNVDVDVDVAIRDVD